MPSPHSTNFDTPTMSPKPSEVSNKTIQSTLEEGLAGAATSEPGSSPGEVAGFTFLGLFLAAAAIGLLGLLYRRKNKAKPSLPTKALVPPSKNLVFENNPMMKGTENPMLRPMSINPVGQIENSEIKTVKHEKLAFHQMRITK